MSCWDDATQAALGQNVGNHFSRHVGQAEIPAVEAVGQFGVLQAEQL